MDIFWKLQFVQHFISKIVPIICQLRDGKRYENDFDQWPKLNLGFDVEPDIQILKGIIK